jgi:hypothetical protein
MEEQYSKGLAILEDALDRCRTEDIRTPEVFAALDFFGSAYKSEWPFKQFREALEGSLSLDWEIEGRRQMLKRVVEWNQASVSSCG